KIQGKGTKSKEARATGRQRRQKKGRIVGEGGNGKPKTPPETRQGNPIPKLLPRATRNPNCCPGKPDPRKRFLGFCTSPLDFGNYPICFLLFPTPTMLLSHRCKPLSSSMMAMCVRNISFHTTPSATLLSRGLASAAARTSVLDGYRHLIEKGELSPDEKQESIVIKLNEIAQGLERYSPTYNQLTPEETAATSTQTTTGKGSSALNGANETTNNGGGFFSRFFGGSAAATARPEIPPVAFRGLYLWGGCGSGKSMLMDLFYQHVAVKAKKRVHFHEWMMDVHSRLHESQLRSS
ncbi:Lactation elevated protein 1, partial [Perkinsus olseni]